MKAALFLIAAILALAGCGTVSQNAVDAQNAGFYVKPVKVADGYIVSSEFRARYNALIAVYGHKKLENGAPLFLPPLTKDAGVTSTGAGGELGGYHMTNEAMENMDILSALKRRGAAP